MRMMKRKRPALSAAASTDAKQLSAATRIRLEGLGFPARFLFWFGLFLASPLHQQPQSCWAVAQQEDSNQQEPRQRLRANPREFDIDENASDEWDSSSEPHLILDEEEEEEDPSFLNETITTAESHRSLNAKKIKFRHRTPSENANFYPSDVIDLGADVFLADDAGDTDSLSIDKVWIYYKRRGRSKFLRRSVKTDTDGLDDTFFHLALQRKEGSYMWRMKVRMTDGQRKWTRTTSTRSFEVVTPNTPVPTGNNFAECTNDLTPNNDPIVYGLQPSCNQNDPCKYNICVDLGSKNGEYRDWMSSFQSARSRWEQIIIENDGEAHKVSPDDLRIIQVATEVPVAIDDVYIGAEELEIDGPGGVLAVAGPTGLKPIKDRRTGAPIYHTISGIMRFDVDDVDVYHRQGSLASIVSHEMAHIFGVGSLWRYFDLHTLGSDEYRGAAGLDAWHEMGCTEGYPPVETGGGNGTKDAHWDDFCMRDEALTGFLSGNNPISNITIASLWDMAYGVNFSAADAYGVGDLRRSALCRKYCNAIAQPRQVNFPFGSRALAEEQMKPPLSKAAHDAATKYGLKVLQERNKEQEEAFRRLSHRDPTKLIYIGGTKVNVITVENGHLHAVSVVNQTATSVFEKKIRTVFGADALETDKKVPGQRKARSNLRSR